MHPVIAVRGERRPFQKVDSAGLSVSIYPRGVVRECLPSEVPKIRHSESPLVFRFLFNLIQQFQQGQYLPASDKCSLAQMANCSYSDKKLLFC